MNYDKKVSKLFHILIDYFYYYIEFSEEQLKFIDEDSFNYYINKEDEEGSNFFHDIIIYTIKTNFKKIDMLNWILQKSININFKNKITGNTALHIFSENINKNNFIIINKYIKILINLGANIYIKNKKNETFINIFKDKIYNNLLNNQFNYEIEWGLLCFDNNKLLEKKEQKIKLIKKIKNYKLKNKEYKKENYEKAITEINNYIYFKNKECFQIYKNKNFSNFTYKQLIKFLNILRKKNIFYNEKELTYYTINTLIRYILPYLNYNIVID